MSTEAYKQVIRDLLAATDRGDFNLIKKYYHAQFVEHNVDSAVHMDEGRQGVEMAFLLFDKAFPSRKHIIEDIIAEGDKVAARITFTGRFENAIGNAEPDGKEYSITGTTFYKFKDGQIIEKWTNISIPRVLNFDMEKLK
jgi:predicted ester cyclase